MSRKKDELRPSEAARAARAALLDAGFPISELTGKALAEAATTAVGKLKAKTAAGLAKADALGVRAAKALAGWTPKTKLTVETAAMITSLLGSTAEDKIIAPFLAFLLETRGIDFLVQVTVAMWTMATNSSDRAAWLHAIDVETTGAHDASVSYGKGDIVQFLCKLRERGPRASEIIAAVGAHYDTAPLPARPPLAVIAADSVRATALAKQFLADKTVYPHWGWRHLPGVVRDFPTMKKLFAKLELTAWAELFETVGVARAIELYELSFARKLDGYTRDRLLKDLAELHGPKTARIMARYLMNKSNRDTVVAYFKKNPGLLDDVLADPACAEDHEYLVTYCKP